MKKKFDDGMTVYCAEDFAKIKQKVSQTHALPDGLRAVGDAFPFAESLLQLLKAENKLEQRYYYLEKGTSFAFFVQYEKRMDIFTFGHLKLFYPVHIVGFPCSLSCPGYVTNDETLLFDFLKTIKGAKLVLNVERAIPREGFVLGETLPTCLLDLTDVAGNPISSMDVYLQNMRSAYRRRIRKAIGACADVVVRENVQDDRVHALYMNTYRKSDYKLECLEKGFFQKADADQLVFYRGDNPIGFVQLKVIGAHLDFMFCGMDYRENTADLYYFMLYHILQFAIAHQCRTVDLGQTSEETKMKFGATLEKKYFYAHHTNPLINFAIRHGKALLEYHYKFPTYHVRKEKP